MRGIQRLISIASAILLAVGFATPAAANNPALVPTFGTPIPIAGGYVAQITNHDPAFTYTAIGSDCSVATVENGWLTVSGVLPSQSVKARVITTQAGYSDGMAVVSGSSAALSARGTVENTTGYATYANHVVGPNGDLYVAWATTSIAANLSKSTNGGQTWSLVKSWPIQSAAINARVAVDTDGDLAMIWQEGTSGNYRVMVSTSSNGGVTWITPVQLNGGQGTQLVSVEFSASGDVLVSWNLFNGSAFVSPFRVSSNMGATWSATANASSPAEASFYPSLVKLSNGQIAMVWVNGAGIRAAMFDDTTKTFAASAVITPANVDIYEIHTSADASGNLVAAWTAGSSGNKSVQFAVFNGTTWSAAETVSAAPGIYSRPQITKTQTAITVGWMAGGNSARIRTTTSLSPLTWGAEVSPSAATTDLYQVKTTSYGPGKLAATWLRRSATTSFYHLDLVTSDDNGVTWSTPIQISTHNDNNYQPIFMPNGLGQLAVLWRIQYSSSLSLKTAVLASTLPADPRSLYQVAEINPGSGHSNIYDMAILNNKMYLIAQHVDTGFELFEFDGTQMRLVQDLLPGPGNGLYDTRFLARTANALYFSATNGLTGYEVYKFDGSTISLLAEVDPAVASPSDPTSQLLAGSNPGANGAIVFGDYLYFSADRPGLTSGQGFSVDLTDPNAQPVFLQTRFSGFTANGFGSPVIVGPNLYFVSGSSVYVTNGTSSPTQIPGTAGKLVQSLGALGNELLITGSVTGNIFDRELMVWDSADPSTPASLGANINTYSGSGDGSSFPIGYVTRCGESYFTASAGFDFILENRELWKWDGFEASLVKDFYTGGTNAGRPQSMTVIGDEVFMFANDGVTGQELWRTKGSETVRLTDLRSGVDGSVSGSPRIMSWNNQIYTAMWGPTGVELYAYGVQPQNHQVATFAMNYTITYDANGGTGGSTATHPAGSVTLPNGNALSMAGKVFAGWDTSSTATTATYAAGASFNLTGPTTLYAVWANPPAQPGAGGTSPTISLPGGSATAVSGGDLKLSGENLGGVTPAEIDSKNAPIKDKSDSSLTIALPELKTGVYDLTLKATSGSLTLQGAVRVVSGSLGITPEAAAKIRAWTKMSASRTSVEIVAKNPVGVGKVQFLVNGKEVKWVRAKSPSDPKLSSQVVDGAAQSYLRHRVRLTPGSNIFEVRVNGDRVWRSHYLSKVL